MPWSTTPLTHDDHAEAGAFVHRLNRRADGRVRCLHSDHGDTAERHAAEMAELGPDARYVVLKDERGRWLGLCGADVSGAQGRAWLRGPLSLDDDPAQHALLIAALEARLPPEVRRVDAFVQHDEAALVGPLRAAGYEPLPLHHVLAIDRDTGPAPAWPAGVRDASPADAGAAAALHGVEFPDGYLTAEMLAAPRPDDQRLLVAVHDERVVGYLAMQLLPQEGEAYVDFLAVDPSARRLGLGRALLDAALHAAFVEHGLPRLALTVRDDRPAALALYRAAGLRTLSVGAHLRKSLGAAPRVDAAPGAGPATRPGLAAVLVLVGVLAAAVVPPAVAAPGHAVASVTVPDRGVQTVVQPQATGKAGARKVKAAARKAGTNADRAPVAYGTRADVMQFAADVAQRRAIDEAWLQQHLQQARHLPSVTRLIMPPPAGTAKNWAAYRGRFVEPQRIAAGRAYAQQHAAWLEQAEARWGVPPWLVLGILGVETYYGRMTGNFTVIDALATLAFDFPAGRRDRSAFFRDELEQLLAWTWREQLDPQTVKGSYAGAIGLPQFMPSSIVRFAVDFDGDGHIDLRQSPADAIGSIAHYMAAFGWQRDLPTHYGVLAPVDAADRAVLLGPDIVPSFTPQQFAERGAELEEAARQHEGLLALVELQNGDAAPSYVAGTSNFYTVTRYNWSSYYALAVIELGQAVAAASR